MLTGVWRAYLEKSALLVAKVQVHDDRVAELHAAIKHSLAQIPAEQMTPRDSQLQFGLLHFASQLDQHHRAHLFGRQAGRGGKGPRGRDLTGPRSRG